MTLPLYSTVPQSKLEVLYRMRELLAKPENWTKGVLARLENGRDCHPYDSKVCTVCLEGARYRAFPSYHAINCAIGAKALADSVFEFLSSMVPKTFETPPAWNDAKQRTHAQVLKFLDKAIDKANKQ